MDNIKLRIKKVPKWIWIVLGVFIFLGIIAGSAGIMALINSGGGAESMTVIKNTGLFLFSFVTPEKILLVPMIVSENNIENNTITSKKYSIGSKNVPGGTLIMNYNSGNISFTIEDASFIASISYVSNGKIVGPELVLGPDSVLGPTIEYNYLVGLASLSGHFNEILVVPEGPSEFLKTFEVVKKPVDSLYISLADLIKDNDVLTRE